MPNIRLEIHIQVVLDEFIWVRNYRHICLRLRSCQVGNTLSRGQIRSPAPRLAEEVGDLRRQPALAGCGQNEAADREVEHTKAERRENHGAACPGPDAALEKVGERATDEVASARDLLGQMW